MIYFKDLENKLHALESVEFTHLLPVGYVEISEQEYQQLIAPPAPTLADLRAEYDNAVQGLIDSVAQAKGYADGVSCASYFNDPHEPFKTEAQTFVTWRSTVWLQCYTDFQAIESGQKPLPNSPQDYIATLPVIGWA